MPAESEPVGAPGVDAAAGTRPRRATVLVASTRASTGVYPDDTGPLIADWLARRRFTERTLVVVADGPPFQAALADAVGRQWELILTTGGTGISPTDRTAEDTVTVLDYQIPGIAEEIRRVGAAKVPTAVLSRGVAGVAGRTLVVTLPGSKGGVKDGLAVLDGVLDHALDQLAGGDHQRGSA